MEKAKAAVSDFMHKSGKHDTTVHETVAPGVQHETVKPHQHENVMTAVDKEVHQDHYHRTVQPVHDREVLPEEHTAKLGGVQHREFDHRDHEGTKQNLAADQSAFRDEQVVHDTTQTQSAAPAVGGEHVHHHIHETIQPVVHKETVQPHVVHTTVPIHETHHNAAQHHSTSELPPMHISDFKAKGGVLGGREEKYDGFDGEPKHIGGTLKHMMDGKDSKRDSAHADRHVREQATHGDYDPMDGRHTHGSGALGPESGATSGMGRGTDSTVPPSATGQRDTYGQHGQHGNHNDTVGSGLNQTTSSKSKPSMLDRLNPMKDTDGDGKKGIMD